MKFEPFSFQKSSKTNSLQQSQIKPEDLVCQTQMKNKRHFGSLRSNVEALKKCMQNRNTGIVCKNPAHKRHWIF